MEVRQVFSEYPVREGRGRRYRYCPYCAQELPAGSDTRRLACSRCGYVHYANPLPGVAVLVTDGRRLLLGKRGPGSFRGGRWGLPGGFIEHEEDFLSAGIRETREETGLEVRIRSIVNVVSNFLSPELHTLVVVLLAEICGGRMRAGDDFVELAWYSDPEPLPDLAFPADRHIIERFYRSGIPQVPVDSRYAAPGG